MAYSGAYRGSSGHAHSSSGAAAGASPAMAAAATGGASSHPHAVSAGQYSAPGASGGATGGGVGSAGPARQQSNLSGVSFGGYGRVSYTTPGNVSSGRSKQVLVRAEETRKPDTLNLDEFLAESNASDLRKISTKKTGKL